MRSGKLDNVHKYLGNEYISITNQQAHARLCCHGGRGGVSPLPPPHPLTNKIDQEVAEFLEDEKESYKSYLKLTRT